MADRLSQKKRIGVLMGGLSVERTISMKTGEAILKALKSKGYDAVPIDVDRRLAWKLAEEKVEIAFVALHGTYGEDGAVQGLLELLHIPYTGSGVLASALSMNKIATKKILLYHKIPTPLFQAFCLSRQTPDDIGSLISFTPPFVVKPASEGSTIGVTIVSAAEELGSALEKARSFGDWILVEHYIEGREVTVGMLDNQPLPVVEVQPKCGFYNYESKYSAGKTDYVVPAKLDSSVYHEVQTLGVDTYRAMGCRGAARVDMRVDREGKAWVLEINTVPGMTETSLLPMAAKTVGIDFADLAERILKGASLET
jgi:D-alanine-D-alanine ligase